MHAKPRHRRSRRHDHSGSRSRHISWASCTGRVRTTCRRVPCSGASGQTHVDGLAALWDRPDPHRVGQPGDQQPAVPLPAVGAAVGRPAPARRVGLASLASTPRKTRPSSPPTSPAPEPPPTNPTRPPPPLRRTDQLRAARQVRGWTRTGLLREGLAGLARARLGRYGRHTRYPGNGRRPGRATSRRPRRCGACGARRARPRRRCAGRKGHLAQQRRSAAHQPTGTRPPQSCRLHTQFSPARACGTPWRTAPPAGFSEAVPGSRAGHSSVMRRPPDPDRNRSVTRTSPSTASGPAPGAVSRVSAAPNSPAARAARASASARVGGPARQLVGVLDVVGKAQPRGIQAEPSCPAAHTTHQQRGRRCPGGDLDLVVGEQPGDNVGPVELRMHARPAGRGGEVGVAAAPVDHRRPPHTCDLAHLGEQEPVRVRVTGVRPASRERRPGRVSRTARQSTPGRATSRSAMASALSLSSPAR